MGLQHPDSSVQIRPGPPYGEYSLMVGHQIVALVVWVQFPVFTLYAVVMELAYVFDSKSKFCGFESRPPHYPYADSEAFNCDNDAFGETIFVG